MAPRARRASEIDDAQRLTSMTAHSATKAHAERVVEEPAWLRALLISASRPVLLTPAMRPAIMAATTTRGDVRRRKKINFIWRSLFYPQIRRWIMSLA